MRGDGWPVDGRRLGIHAPPRGLLPLPKCRCGDLGGCADLLCGGPLDNALEHLVAGREEVGGPLHDALRVDMVHADHLRLRDEGADVAHLLSTKMQLCYRLRELLVRHMLCLLGSHCMLLEEPFGKSFTKSWLECVNDRAQNISYILGDFWQGRTGVSTFFHGSARAQVVLWTTNAVQLFELRCTAGYANLLGNSLYNQLETS